MRKLLSIPVVVLAIGLLSLQIGCQKKSDRKTPVNPRNSHGRGMTDSTVDPLQNNNQYSCSYSNSQLNGFFYVDNNEQQDQSFRQGLYNILSGVGADPIDYFGLGYVSAKCGSDTGVRFVGNIELQNGALNINGFNNGRVNESSSYLGFVVFDEYSATQSAPGIGIGSQSVSGEVNGNSATVRLHWDGGVVEFRGNINGQEFSGSVHQSNQWVSYFSVPTCEFFRCR